jgi:Effector Associated Constant Component 1
MTIRVTISIPGHNIEELEELRDWIKEECAAGVGIRIDSKPPTTGSMGGVAAELVAILSGGTGIALARALTTYIKTRRGSLEIVLKRPSDGARIELTATNVAEAGQIIMEFLDFANVPDESASN